MQSKLLPISATDILTLHRLTEMSVVSAKESVHVVFREKNLFVVSKVAAEHKTYEDAKASIDKTLSDMGLDYLDMMIIHSPQPWVEVNQSDNRYVEGNRAAWKALEEAYKEGKLKAIGVSNFQIGDIESLLDTCGDCN